MAGYYSRAPEDEASGQDPTLDTGIVRPLRVELRRSLSSMGTNKLRHFETFELAILRDAFDRLA